MSGEAVKVIVRCRPVNEREQHLQCDVVVSMDTKIMQAQLVKPKADPKITPPKLFTFDGVYGMEDTTQKIYEDICFPLVSSVLEGYNGTVFAYGQTGCGKSFTMVGIEEQLGIIPRAFDHIFDYIAVTNDSKFLVHSSYLEIYNEEVRDLLGKDVKKKLELKEHPERGVYVSGLSLHKVHNRQELEKVMAMGSKNRSMGATLMNVDSSRSHCIFTIDIEIMTPDEGGDEKLKAGKLNLVDLAGSERQSKTGATGERLKEATKINLSLSALGNVISALVDGKSKHIPYRDSKLTRLLQSSLGGNTKTLMIACVSPADNNYDETLSTLRYANRAKNIKNKPRINEDPKDALLREYQEEINKLKMMLLGQMDIPDELRGSLIQGQQSQSVSSRDYDAELAAIKADYEAKISHLQDQYGQEQANRSKLEEEMAKLKTDYEAQLATAKEKQAVGTYVTVGSGDGDGDGDGGSTRIGPDEERLPANDQQILSEHEAALQKLANLQEGLIGGEKADDNTLKQTLETRKQHAEDRTNQLRKANSFLEDDDDGILEKIFNNLTDEVRAKTRALEHTQYKLKSAEEDNKDLQHEFEEERQSLFDIIREQERQLQLQRQLLDTMVPLIRRDCNYYNLDKVKSECKYNEEEGEWLIPKVTLTSTSLSAVLSKGSLVANPQSPSHLRKAEEGRPHSPAKWSEEDQYGSKLLSRPDNTDYFVPKRAKELLAECTVIKGSPSLDRNNKSMRTSASLGTVNKSPSHSGLNGSLFNIESQFMPMTDGKGKPRKLNSISHLPGNVPAPPAADTSTIEHLDRMIAQRKKPKQLGPLSEHTRKQF